MSQSNPTTAATTSYLSLLIVLLGLFAAVFSPFTSALSSDKKQPIHIRSNSAERDDSKGVTVYSGDVEMVQGSQQIRANRVIIYSDGSTISRIIATGSPAQYQHTPAEDKKHVIARGNRIIYEVEAETINLSKNASLQQGDGTTMIGDSINYDIKAAIVRAGSNSSLASDRIHMVIPPKADNDTDSGSAN